MSFAIAQPVPRHPLDSSEAAMELIEGNDGWPSVDPKIARVVLRLNGTVTNERLRESLENSIQAVQREISTLKHDLVNQLTVRQVGLYLRAVYFTTKADLAERYRDFDTTEAGNRVADSMDAVVRDARRTVRWAVADLMERPRVTIDVL